MKFHKKGFFAAAMFVLLIYSAGSIYAVTPWLYTDANKIKDPLGNVVVLRGVDLVDLGATELWYGGAINMIDRLTDMNDTQGSSPGWYTRVVRLAIYPADEGDFSSPWTFESGSDDFYNNLLRPTVDYCKSKDLYVIIDWHYVGDNTWDKLTKTSEFWAYMAPRFANDSHVLFELFNEPGNDVGSDEEDWISVRDDMQTWIDVVRSYAPNNLILVAGAWYSQIIGPAADYPLTGNNIVIVSHIYPGHWNSDDKDWYTGHIDQCLTRYPVFMSEWGFCNVRRYSSRWLMGTISNYGQPLMDFCEERKISNSAWIASYDWRPPMFWDDWTLRVGEDYMGGFVKDTLYLRRNDDQPQGGNPSTPPVAPTNLDATAISSGQIDLAWTDNSDNEFGFSIERKTGTGGTYAEIDTVSANITSYQDTGLEALTTYFYRVLAYNPAGDSDYSNEDSATTLEPSLKMHVDSIFVDLIPTVGKNRSHPYAEVVILASAGVPVEGATVTGTFTGDTVQGPYSADTDATGLAIIEGYNKKDLVSVTFCVEDVTHPSLTYDPAANVETCDSN